MCINKTQLGMDEWEKAKKIWNLSRGKDQHDYEQNWIIGPILSNSFL